MKQSGRQRSWGCYSIILAGKNGDLLITQQCEQIPEGRVQRRQNQALFSGAQWQDNRQWAQTETQEVLEHQETFFHCESDQAVAQRGGGVSIPGDIQKLSGHSPEPPGLGGHA